jgi:hypothetical protein
MKESAQGRIRTLSLGECVPILDPVHSAIAMGPL